MKVDIVSAVFWPEPVISARTSAAVAERLHNEGDRVRVITTFPSRPAGKLYHGYKRKLWANDDSLVGYSLLRCFSALSSESTMLSRFSENLSFGIAAGISVLLSRKPDVIYGNTWPIFAQGILALVCRSRGIPLIMSVQDVYPESLATQCRANQRFALFFRLLRWLDQQAKKSCAAIVVISEHFRQIHVQDRGISPEKLHLIPNWCDGSLVQANAPSHGIRRMHEIPGDAFLVVYAGNVGFAAGVDAVIQAFGKLAAETSIYLLIAGEGSLLADCRRLARNTDNPRISFHSPWLDSETSSLLAAANLLILPTQGEQSIVSVPSKLISYMLASRPVLSCVAPESEVAKVVTDASCGWIVPPANTEAIATQILLLSRYPPEELARFGQRGREYAVRQMTSEANLPKLISLIHTVGCRN